MTTRRSALRRIAAGAVGSLTGVLLVHGVHALSVKCPICNSGAFFTGETWVDVSGALLMKYQCLLYSQNVSWVPS